MFEFLVQQLEGERTHIGTRLDTDPSSQSGTGTQRCVWAHSDTH